MAPINPTIEVGHNLSIQRTSLKTSYAITEMPARAALSKHGPTLALLILLTVAAAHDLRLFLSYSVAGGVNGYYYVLQVSQIVSHHHVYFARPNALVLYALAGCAYLTGNSITAIKLGGVVLNTLLSLGIFKIIQSTLRERWLAVLGSALSVIPHSHLYMTTEYLNQLGALVLLVWAGWLAIVMVGNRRKAGGLIVAVVLIGSLFSHKSALLFVPALISGALLIIGLTDSRTRKIALPIIVLLWLLPGIIAAQPFATAPEWLRAQISIRPQWPFESAVITEELMLLLAASGVLLLVLRRSPESTWNVAYLVFGTIALASLLITLNPFFNARAMQSGVAGRSRLFCYIQVSLLAPGLIWLVMQEKRKAAIYVGGVLLSLLFLTSLEPMPYGLRPEFIARRMQLIDSLKTHSGEIAQNSTIVAPHGDQFVITATIGIASQQRPNENPGDKYVYWLLNDVSDPVLNSQGISLFKNEHGVTILVQDSVFNLRWETMTSFERTQLLAPNPYLAPILGHSGN
jgi:hypothetical protein